MDKKLTTFKKALELIAVGIGVITQVISCFMTLFLLLYHVITKGPELWLALRLLLDHPYVHLDWNTLLLLFLR